MAEQFVADYAPFLGHGSVTGYDRFQELSLIQSAMTYKFSPNTERAILIAILLLATALRVIAVIVIADQSQALPDVLDYRDSAEHFLKAGLVVNPYQMPLYPLLIAVTGPGNGQLGTEVTLSVLTVWLSYVLADHLFSNQYPRIILGLVAACYPSLVFFAIIGVSETCSSHLFCRSSCAGTVDGSQRQRYLPCWQS